jgi:hypothetical protein
MTWKQRMMMPRAKTMVSRDVFGSGPWISLVVLFSSEGEDMDIDDEYRAEETTIPPPSETPTPPAAPAATGIKLRLTLNNKNKNTSTSSSSTATNAEAGPSSVRTSSRAKKQSAKADAAAFEDDVSQASGGTNRGKSGRSSKRVKLDIGSGQ